MKAQDERARATIVCLFLLLLLQPLNQGTIQSIFSSGGHKFICTGPLRATKASEPSQKVLKPLQVVHVATEFHLLFLVPRRATATKTLFAIQLY